MPGVPHLMIVNFRQIVRRVETERADIEAANCTQECVGCNYAIALRQNLAGARCGKILLGIKHVDGGALSRLRLAPHALRVIARARQASIFARDWAVLRHDLDVDEVTIAALLHDSAEILLWCFAPTLMLNLRARQAEDRTLRSAAAQEAVLGIRGTELQLALAKAWRLPELLLSLMDDSHAEHPRVRNVIHAVNLARHAAKGWDDPAIPDDLAEIGKLLGISEASVLERLRRLVDIPQDEEMPPAEGEAPPAAEI